LVYLFYNEYYACVNITFFSIVSWVIIVDALLYSIHALRFINHLIKEQNEGVVISFLLLFLYLLSVRVFTYHIEFRLNQYQKKKKKVMESNDVCMRRSEKFKIERRERKNILKKNIANQSVQISKKSNDTYSERENVEFKHMSKIEQIIYFSFR
jgi:hypothetical protein